MTDVGWQVAAQDGRVIVAGSVGDGLGANHWIVRAYDAVTGTVVWSDLRDSEAGFAAAWSIVLAGDRAIVAGFGGDCSIDAVSNCDWIIRTYEQRAGTLLWERRVDHAGGDDQPFIVTAQGDRVVVAGYGSTSFGAFTADWIVRVYDAKSGALAWQDVVSGGFGEALGASITGDQLFVVGDVFDESGNDDWLVRAYVLRGAQN